MKTLHFEAGYKRASEGGWRALPSNIKILTQAYKDWYSGFDTATKEGKNPKLTTTGKLRKPSRTIKVTPY